MGHSQADKALSRERILREAAAQIRTRGLDAVTIGSVMKGANLTHGGFYCHFESRDDLVSQALEYALHTNATTPVDVAPAAGFTEFIEDYLSPRHRGARERGCGVAALMGDVARLDDKSKAVMQSAIESYFSAIATRLGDESDERAIVAVCEMVGALALSRAVADTERSTEILDTVRQHLVNFGDAPQNAVTSL